MISAGRMNERVSLLAPTESRGAMGEATISYDTEDTVWAEVEGLTARDVLQAQQADVVASHRIRIRHRPTISYQHRVVWRGKTMEVASVSDRMGRTMTELLVREIV